MIRLIIALLYISIASQSALAQGVHKYIFSGSYIKDGHKLLASCNYSYMGISIRDSKEAFFLISPLLKVSNKNRSSFGRQLSLKLPINTKRKLQTRKLNTRPHKLYYNRVSYFQHNKLNKVTNITYDSKCNLGNPFVLVRRDLKDELSVGVISFF